MKVIIAGGGTGGHLFPGIAIAQAFLQRDPGTEILFVGTEKGLENRILPQQGYALALIPIGGVRGVSFWRKARALIQVPWALLESFGILNRFRPDLVIGVGGYASGPVVLGAFLKGIKAAIHEQNARAGATNRILSLWADRVFVSHEETVGEFPSRKTLCTGNPVRKEFIDRFRRGDPSPSPTGKAEGPFHVLVFGGSQGARHINQSLVEALDLLKDLRDRLEFTVQTGSTDGDGVHRAMEGSGFRAEVHPFIHEMAEAYDRADLVICRAGATTLAEITVSGRPAVLIPYPFAIGDHQSRNAEALRQAGAAVVVQDRELSGPVLADVIRRLCTDRERVRQMGRKAWDLGKPEAADRIVEECLRLIQASGSKLRASGSCLLPVALLSMAAGY